MRSCITRISLFSVLIALLGALAPVAPARAFTDDSTKTAADVLDECLQMIEDLNHDIVAAMEAQTTDTIAQINLMRADDASQKQLKKTAKRGKKDLSNIGRSGLAQLNRITGECMIRMRRIGSTRELNNALLAARSGAFSLYKSAAKDGGEQIDAALAGELDVEPQDGIPEDFQGTPL